MLAIHPVEMMHQFDILIDAQWERSEPDVPEMHFKFYDPESGEEDLTLMKIDLYFEDSTEDPTYIFYDSNSKVWRSTDNDEWTEEYLLSMSPSSFSFTTFFWDKETFNNMKEEDPMCKDGWFDEGSRNKSREITYDAPSLRHIYYAL